MAVHRPVGGPAQYGTNRPDPEVHEGRRQTGRQQAHAGSRLKPLMFGKAPPDRPAFQPYWGKPAVRNERGDRGNVGIIRSPVRASILPDTKFPWPTGDFYIQASGGSVALPAAGYDYNSTGLLCWRDFHPQ